MLSGVPNALEWATSLLPSGGPQCFKAGDKIRSGPQMGRSATSPLPSGGCPTLEDKIKSGPQVGGLATSPLPFGGSPKWGRGIKGSKEIKGSKDQSGYLTPAFSGFPIVGRCAQETKWCLFSRQEWCRSIHPLPPPDFGGSIDTLPPLKTCHPKCLQVKSIGVAVLMVMHVLVLGDGEPIHYIKAPSRHLGGLGWPQKVKLQCLHELHSSPTVEACSGVHTWPATIVCYPIPSACCGSYSGCIRLHWARLTYQSGVTHTDQATQGLGLKSPAGTGA